MTESKLTSLLSRAVQPIVNLLEYITVPSYKPGELVYEELAFGSPYSVSVVVDRNHPDLSPLSQLAETGRDNFVCQHLTGGYGTGNRAYHKASPGKIKGLLTAAGPRAESELKGLETYLANQK